MALIGALAGVCLYGLIEIVDRDVVNDRLVLTLIAFAGTFFATLLAMAGPIGTGR